MGQHPTTSLHQKSEHDGCLVSRQAAKCLCQCKWPGGKAMPIAKFWRKNHAPEEYLLLHIGNNDVSSWFNDSKWSQQIASHLLFCITAKGLPWNMCFTKKSTLSQVSQVGSTTSSTLRDHKRLANVLSFVTNETHLQQHPPWPLQGLLPWGTKSISYQGHQWSCGTSPTRDQKCALNRLELRWYITSGTPTTIYKWMFGETTIFYVKIWNHPIETSIYNWLFGVPGCYIQI